jgi:hypothetical protein
MSPILLVVAAHGENFRLLWTASERFLDLVKLENELMKVKRCIYRVDNESSLTLECEIVDNKVSVSCGRDLDSEFSLQ